MSETSAIRAVHGGAFFDAIGVDFATLGRRNELVNADVLDAWYDPAPAVIETIEANLSWLIRTSPPTHGDGLRAAIAQARGVDRQSLVLGPGSSSLMFLTFPKLISKGSRVVALDPTYGEYAHLAGKVIGAEIVRSKLDPSNDFVPDLHAVASDCAGADLVVLVNPNSPTGVCVGRSFVSDLLEQLDSKTRLWVDETYIDYAPAGTSAEPLVAKNPQLIVCKSMSKYYGLSGLRIGYLVCSRELATEWESLSPPWSVSLIGQVAAVAALSDPGYYRAMTVKTNELRAELSEQLMTLPGVKVFPSITNFLLMGLDRPISAQVCAGTEAQGVFLRDCDSLSPEFKGHYVRTAVKDRADNARIVDALRFLL